MTFATALAAGNRQQVDVSVFIDGIPVLFGTRAGLVLSMAALVDNVGPYGTLTSVNAINPEAVSFDGTELDYDLLMVPASSGALSIRLEQPGEDWDRYFEPRTLPQPRITALMDHNDTSVTVSNSAGLTAGLLYLDRETLYWDGSLATHTLSGITRNVLGLPLASAEVHHQKAVLSTVPRYVEDRVAVIHIWLDGIVSQVYRYVKIARSSTKSRTTGEWDIEFEDIMSVFSRQCALGFEGSKVKQVDYSTPAYYDLYPDDESRRREFRNHAGDPGALMLSGEEEDGTPFFKIVPSTFAGTTYATIERIHVGDIDMSRVKDMRRCYVFRDPMLAALQILLSDTGDGTNNATYDVCFGITTTGTGVGATQVANNEPELRFGAGIPTALVDVTTLESFIGRSPAGWVYILGAKGEEPLPDILREIARAVNGYWAVSDGKLTFKLFDGAYETDTITAVVTDSDILDNTPRKSINDESEIITTITSRCNWSPLEDEYKGKISVVYPEIMAIYRNTRRVVEQDRRGMYVSLPSQDTGRIIRGVAITPATPQQVLSASERIFARRSKGLRKWQLNLPMTFFEVEPGDKLTMTWDQLDDFAGSYPNGATVEVTAQAWAVRAGTITLQVTEVHNGKLLSPTLEVKAWVDPTITFDTICKFHTDTTPSNWLAVGWKCRIWDASDNFATYVNFTVASIPTTDKITVSTMPGFTPALRDLVTFNRYDDADDATANAAQGLGQRSYIFLADGTFTLGTAADESDRWA